MEGKCFQRMICDYLLIEGAYLSKKNFDLLSKFVFYVGQWMSRQILGPSTNRPLTSFILYSLGLWNVLPNVFLKRKIVIVDRKRNNFFPCLFAKVGQVDLSGKDQDTKQNAAAKA